MEKIRSMYERYDNGEVGKDKIRELIKYDMNLPTNENFEKAFSKVNVSYSDIVKVIFLHQS